MTVVGPWPRTTNVTAVAHASAANTKNCQGWRRCCDRSLRSEVTPAGCAASVEVAELIVEAFRECRILAHGRGFRGFTAARKPQGNNPDDHRAAGADHV